MSRKDSIRNGSQARENKLMSKSKERFASLLCELAQSDDNSRQAKGRELMQAFLEFGSATDDNMNCYSHIEYGSVPPGACNPKETYGLKLKGKDILISDVVHLLEGLDLPDRIKKDFPNITENEWAAVTRMATMILIAFERQH